ncbi:N-(5'-phosphoribosyl)anthranilate isomerase [Botrimarina hoheduenensis]|uniref:N-(5'-phosphoribosyl)anthranilate isomerase n=1 Tax=Botrimarina hoheduenensis TaxID=2528000 RepID=A0A5C5WDD8_9BACT|nr:N-(5'-phosphoribosyl)anthranilate isomerase [Botrimarina hoheduenensis]
MAAGADAIGVNFYRPSPRSIDLPTAQEIARAVAGQALVVGVFVNAPPEEILRLVEAVPLDAVQLHGDETPELAAQIPADIPIVRAYRCDQSGLAPLRKWLDDCERLGRCVAAVLIDAPGGPGEYGGTGKTVNWGDLRREAPRLGNVPLILAGGLRPENVAQAIGAVQPSGVDTASGVESAPGRKSPERVEAFVRAALAALNVSSAG